MIPTPAAVIIGSELDPHVAATVEVLAGRADVVVIDAETLRERLTYLASDSVRLETIDGRGLTLGEWSSVPVRGWIRRVAPAGWDDGTVLGSREAASAAARLSLLASLVRLPWIEWLTDSDALAAAENKTVQYRCAGQLGIPVPEWLVANSVGAIVDRLGRQFVLKPLGPGQFTDPGGDRKVVHVRRIDADSLGRVDLSASPFIAQEAVEAVRHLRIVTLEDSAWVAELDATDVPTDWRESDLAHRSFRPAAAVTSIAADAVRLAREMRVRMSSQDWIVTSTGTFFVDCNPSGQWLFLPEEIHQPATRALAGWLAGG